MKLETNNCYTLIRRDAGEELIFLLDIRYGRTVDGKPYCCLTYSEVYGYIETDVDINDVISISPVQMTKPIITRLIEKWGEALARERGVYIADDVKQKKKLKVTLFLPEGGKIDYVELGYDDIKELNRELMSGDQKFITFNSEEDGSITTIPRDKIRLIRIEEVKDE